MSIFGSAEEQAVMDILRDPVEGEGITPDGLPEEEANDMTEAEAEPETEAEAEGQAADAGEPEAQPEPEAEPEAPAQAEEAPAESETVDMARYKAAVKEMNAKQREAAESSKRIAELEAELQQLKDSALQMSLNKPMTEDEKVAFLQGLKDNPQQTMFNMLSPVLTSMMDSRQKEERQRFENLQFQQKSDQDLRTAYNAMVNEWSQLKDPNQGSEVLKEMFALAENTLGKGEDSWRYAPELFLREALIKTYGLPIKPDQKAIEAAKKRGYEEGLTQRQQREADKAKATPASGSPPEAEPPETEEDRIRREILAQNTGRVF